MPKMSNQDKRSSQKKTLCAPITIEVQVSALKEREEICEPHKQAQLQILHINRDRIEGPHPLVREIDPAFID